ncbi:kinesin-like protein KIF9 [Anguilla anguilla]|uniref:kinesin-like protein KIF9 n=1 Tax=Anguilla anguilla TaxID=7936 RepID=UPI0015AB7660|nr:kinesin-like protein KIF9 [Anguilla anguilla]XP_035268629.1 kinesin-like protein KIF9 [Anguilla anguilla]
MNTHGSEVKVFARTRPTANFAQDLIEYLPDGQTVNVRLKKDSRKGIVNNQLNSWSFRLDRVLHDVSQEEVYSSVARSVVLGALDGYNGTVMCFGQTGAGKTYTMTGATESYKERGIIPRAIQEVFREVERRSDHIITVRLSFLEIYNETLLDLLSSVKDTPTGAPAVMSIVDEGGGGVTVKGLSMHLVHNEEEALNLLFEGEMNRIIGAHTLNRNSSRSHCIFTVHIESHSRTLSDAKYVTSKLNLVDLAGSERLGKTGSEGQILIETMYINKSLSFLEQAILALADRRRDHVPFRQSKLTHALKDSLGGNCNTVLVANVYGEVAQIEETLSTLRFASRMKCVRTEPAVNEHVDPVIQIKKLQKEIQLLKQELSIRDTLANRTGMSYGALTETQVAEIQSQVLRYFDGTLDEINIVSIRQVKEVFVQFKLALQQREQKIKADMIQNFALAEKTQSTQSAANAKGPNGMVGEIDGPSFGVGMAPPLEKNSRLQSPHRSKTKKGKDINRKEGAGSPAQVKEEPAVSSTSRINPLLVSQKDIDGQEPEMLSQDSQGPPAGDRENFRADSPPPKAAAFEDFKAERGSEINRILKENKAVLVERRRRLRELTDGVNAAKREIDRTSAELQQRREQSQRHGRFVSADGEPVLEEAELALLLRLQELKGQYRQQYKELRGTKAEVSYCEHLVDQCRTRLLSEFESWYNESFLIPEETQAILRSGDPAIQPGHIPMAKALALEEDDQEHFEHLRSELLKSPGAISYFNAHDRTLQRRNYTRTSTQKLQQKRSSEDNGRTKLPAILSVT